VYQVNVEFYGSVRESRLFGEMIVDQMARVVETGRYLQSTFVEAFENKIKRRVGRLKAVAVNSGTDALTIALKSIGVSKDDEVLVPAYSFVASASCVSLAGATPVFVDCGDDYNMDLAKAESLISKKTKAIIYADLFGWMGDNPADVIKFAIDHKIYLIEDAAQAYGATRKGHVAGSIGDISCFSFDPTKPLSAPGSGGMILTNNICIAEVMKKYRYHCKGMPVAGLNSQLNSISAAVLDMKENFVAPNQQHRYAAALKYWYGLEGIIDIKQLFIEEGHANSKFVIEVDNRDDLKEFLGARGIQTKVSYYRTTAQNLGFGTSCPVAECKCNRVLSLPMHPYLDDQEIMHVIDSILEWRRSNDSDSQYSVLQ
jgi:dTDP-4-amino-4,6-dideoxygalactose transaminase